MKQIIIIFCTIFIKTFAEDASFENETVGSLLLPRLHLNRLKTKTLHDLTTARLRHLLPIPRHHHLLLEETPTDFIDDETDFNLNDTNNFVINNTDPSDDEINIKEMMKKMFYYVIDEQKNNFKNDSVNEVEFSGKNMTINEEVFNRLKEIFTETVKEEMNKSKSILVRKRRNKEDFKNRMDHLMHTMMHNIKNYLSNETVLNHLYEMNPNLDEEILQDLEPFMLDQKSVNQKNSDSNEENESSKTEELNDFAINNEDNFNEDDQKVIGFQKLGSEGEEKLINLENGNDPIEKPDQKISENVEASRHKGAHTHHFSLTHGINHHPTIPLHPPLKPHHFYSHPNPPQHLNTHVIVNNHNLPQNHHYPPKYYNPHLQKSSELDYLSSFIIQAPRNYPNKFYDHLQRFKRSVPLLKLIADPNVKLDMPKTMENIGTVAKNSFEDDKAPMFHIRNMVGSAKNVILAALRIPPQDIMIPTQYKIMDRGELKNQKKSPEIVSRFLDDSEEEKCLNTFKRMGFMLRESIKSGQETLQHMTDVAHSARKAFVTTGSATPKFITPYVKATAIKKDKKIPEKLMLIAPRIGELTDEESQPDPTDDYVKIGDLMDAFGVSNPEKNKVGLTRFVVHPKKLNKIQSRFGNNDEKNKDFFIVAEHIDDDKNAINSKSIKDMVDDLREKILKKSKSSKDSINNQYGKLMENLFPLKNDKNDNNEISGKIDQDFEDIVNFDWEKFQDFNNNGKEIDAGKDKSNQNVDYNELYQKIVNEK